VAIFRQVAIKDKRKRQVKQFLCRPWGFQALVAPRFKDTRYIKVVRLLALSPGHFYPQEIFLVLISLRD
jgi:hypothetical protein